MSYTYPILFFLISFAKISVGQSIIDSCFTSLPPKPNMGAGAILANIDSIQSDLLEWTGTEWIGQITGANVTIPPPSEKVKCRAIFIGSGTLWTTNGEGFGLRLSAPLLQGQTYSFDFTYVSHGTAS